jgi:hypothetical protein
LVVLATSHRNVIVVLHVALLPTRVTRFDPLALLSATLSNAEMVTVQVIGRPAGIVESRNTVVVTVIVLLTCIAVCASVAAGSKSIEPNIAAAAAATRNVVIGCPSLVPVGFENRRKSKITGALAAIQDFRRFRRSNLF